MASSVFTLWKERYDESWLEIFDILWSRVLGSVVLVWFVFQVGETAMGAYQYFMDLKKARLQEAEDRVRKWIEEALRRQGVSEEEIRQVLKLADALERER